MTSHCASSYDGSHNVLVNQLDDMLLVIITGTTKAINRLNAKSWGDLIACMMNNPLLVPVNGSDIYRSDTFTKKGTHVFHFDGSPDDEIVREVNQWFSHLIKDEDILAETRIDVRALAGIVAETGAAVGGLFSLVAKGECEEQEVKDLGILRYPDIDDPYFKLYRIHLKAWRDCTRFLAVQRDNNGIIGYFNCMKFKPRDSVIKGFDSELNQKAISDADELLLA